MGSDLELAEAITELSCAHRRPFDETCYAEVLVRLVTRLSDVADAGVFLTDNHDRLASVASSSQTVRLLQLVQIHYGAGPGVTSYRDRRVVSIADLRSNRSCGDVFRTATLNAGYAAVHVIPLSVPGEAVGSLVLFRCTRGELATGDRVVATALANTAATQLITARDIGKAERLTIQLQTALRSRIVIEQAKGILAERHGLPLNSAFEAMRSFARNGRRRLEEVANAVVDNSPSVARLTSSGKRDSYARPGSAARNETRPLAHRGA